MQNYVYPIVVIIFSVMFMRALALNALMIVKLTDPSVKKIRWWGFHLHLYTTGVLLAMTILGAVRGW